ncbi:uncharacterized protein BT62DRAFT_1074649 [Guyanagaster necrorhizus]|uniref:Uncharacterized protein n=1 Tax=Guyanagaster necrorhizus TaxID=856835 RepID=A0A9P8AU60_9AGAR|nr:uncharacterized protein BT62DRAFT_1074649 [Guyanagaster necrorhizus MCA 3950]KAG7448144.1 hypothetical protein BT62DRAFT_1074649 [Guyanagaster necrorhizus MCA 3950]
MQPCPSFLPILSSYLKVLPWCLWLCFPKSIRSSIYLRLEKWYDVGEWSVWHLPFSLILKHTQDRPPEIEANNIKFVRENTTVPVPRILKGTITGRSTRRSHLLPTGKIVDIRSLRSPQNYGASSWFS